MGEWDWTQKFSNAECPCTVSVDNQDNVWAITEHYQGSQHTTKFSKYNYQWSIVNFEPNKCCNDNFLTLQSIDE